MGNYHSWHRNNLVPQVDMSITFKHKSWLGHFESDFSRITDMSINKKDKFKREI